MRPAESRLCRPMDMCLGLTTRDWMTYGCYFEPEKKSWFSLLRQPSIPYSSSRVGPLFLPLFAFPCACVRVSLKNPHHLLAFWPVLDLSNGLQLFFINKKFDLPPSPSPLPPHTLPLAYSPSRGEFLPGGNSLFTGTLKVVEMQGHPPWTGSLSPLLQWEQILFRSYNWDD